MDLAGRRASRTVLLGSKGASVNRGVNWDHDKTNLFSAGGGVAATAARSGKTRHARNATARSCGTVSRRLVTKMPVAVPRVPYRTPQEGNWQWVDLWNCLYRERILFVGQGVTEELGNQLVGTLLYLDSVSQKDLQMYINTCEGGSLVPSLALYDTMRHLKSDIVTVGFGGVMGMAAFLMCSGTKGKRLSLAHTRIMMHLPSGAARGSSTDMWNETRELLRIRGYMLKCLEQQTGKTKEKLLEDFSRNTYFTPETAVEYGLIDQVLRPRRKQGK